MVFQGFLEFFERFLEMFFGVFLNNRILSIGFLFGFL